MIGSLSTRSSFGAGSYKSKRMVIAYANFLSRSFSHDVDVSFLALPRGYDGGTKCVFDSANKLRHYRMDVSDFGFAGARQDLDKAFVRSIVTVGHETWHIHQLESGDPEMALCHLARCGNDDNYTHNYCFNRREIAAELNGLLAARKYFATYFPSIDGDTFLLAYVNERADPCGESDDHRSYFIKKPDEFGFRAMNDVFSAFDDAYDAARAHVNKYGPRISADSEDAFAILTGAGSRSGFDHDWEFVYDALANAGDAHSSNMVLASTALYVYPIIIRETFGADLPDLSIQAVFGVDPPADKRCTDEKAGGPKQMSMTPNLDRLQMLLSESDDVLGPGPQGGVEY